ncbi:MAG: hypothetical protein QME68_03260 [Elusimicrobiota bacterium]|nr:hypothetical protein [Elusimicrobiota bacterium]
MTFRESEHINILEKLFELSEQNLPMDRVIRETAKLNSRIPLYPGLVVSCLNSLTENVTIEDVNVGDEIVITQDNETIYGVISEKLTNGFILDDVRITKKLNSLEVKLTKEKSIVRFKPNILEKLWPSLTFDKNKKLEVKK